MNLKKTKRPLLFERENMCDAVLFIFLQPIKKSTTVNITYNGDLYNLREVAFITKSSSIF